MSATPDPAQSESLAGLPTLSQAARIIGVAPSTLSRRGDVRFQRRGDRDFALTRAEVFRLANVYRKRGSVEIRRDLDALAEATVDA